MVLLGLDLGWLQSLVFSLPIFAKGGGGGGLFKSSSPPKPPALPPPPPPPPSIASPVSPEDPAVAQARKDEQEAGRKGQGRRSLITNIGGAVGDLSEAPTGRGSLLALKTKTGG